CLQYNSAPRTF
nr:immunoglobulin light chain junction region [Macaca mulatta]